jgi:hypothetical protein
MGNPKPIFRNLVIAGVGNLQRPGGNGQFTDKNIARWVTLRGGMYLRPGVGVISPSSSAEDGEDEEKDGGGAGRKKNGGKKEADAKLPEEVTHLVCSKETFWEMGAVGESCFPVCWFLSLSVFLFDCFGGFDVLGCFLSSLLFRFSSLMSPILTLFGLPLPLSTVCLLQGHAP